MSDFGVCKFCKSTTVDIDIHYSDAQRAIVERRQCVKCHGTSSTYIWDRKPDGKAELATVERGKILCSRCGAVNNAPDDGEWCPGCRFEFSYGMGE